MTASQAGTFAELASSLLSREEVSTPFLLIDEEKVGGALGYFERHLSGVSLYYAMKANPSPSVVQLFADRGLNFDVASAGEIELVTKLGISGDRLYLSTPIKKPNAIAALFEHKVGCFAFDTAAELERIAKTRKQLKSQHSPRAFCRIRVESKDVEVDLNTKFGCALTEAVELLKRAHDLGFEVGGIAFHVGTQSANSANYKRGIESAILVARETKRRYGIDVPVINIGGGFCDPKVAAEKSLDLESFYRELGGLCQKAMDAGFKVIAEPGRCLVASAGAVVTSILGVNERNQQRWAYIDDGIYGCYSIKLYESPEFEFSIVKNPLKRTFAQSEETVSWTIAGPTCDSLDVVVGSAHLPSNLEPGDVVVSENLGAYSVSTACAFNGFELPACYVVKDGAVIGGKKVELQPVEIEALGAIDEKITQAA